MKSMLTKLTASCLVVATLSMADAAKAQEPFRFAWPSAINSGVAPLTFAEALGFFEAEDLSLELISLTGSGVIIPQLTVGNIDAAYSGLEPAVLSHQPDNPDLGIYFVYNFIPNSIWEMVVLEGSDIQSIEDMRGKTIGVLALGSSNVITSKAILQSKGIAEDEVTFQAVGVGAAAYQALISGQIDVLNLFDTAHSRLELSGTAIRRLEYPEGFSGSSHGISVARATYDEKPEFFGKFGRIVAKANLACAANLEACIRSYWEAYPELAPAEAERGEAMEREKFVLTSRLENLLGEEGQYGAFPEGDWLNLVAALEAGGLVTDPDVPLNRYYTNDLVPMFNDFDPKEVVRLAEQAE
ncbi:ABC transporter substrate-binding protein [Roseovarius nubinhibens]|uniref:SsuA/THI5-like domain-containing protein n=1 Tax=Roseovarius nubinhibens TaxID=314263 RepID=A0A348WFK8_9RHOB|nr:hypothetical protein [Roseovarius nubinhibens]|tara:strand:- start:5921 stop:6985 length:1065 start_codon:yes stop_codon:yes gene_type:complete